MARMDQPILLRICLYFGSPGRGTLRCIACQTHRKIVCLRSSVSEFEVLDWFDRPDPSQHENKDVVEKRRDQCCAIVDPGMYSRSWESS
jgi:hypothetical protein